MYGVKENGFWNLTTIYRQPLPTGFYNASEMHGMCLVVPDNTNIIRVIGQEMIITGENQYSSELVSFSWKNTNNIVGNSHLFKGF